MLVNTLAPDEKYRVLNRDNLTIPIQMQLFQEKSFFSIFSAFLKSRLNFKYFKTKYDAQRFFISEYKDFEKVVR